MFGVLVFSASKRLILLHMDSRLESAVDESMPFELSNTKLKVEFSFLPLLVMAEMYEISHGCALQSLSSGQLHVSFIFPPVGYYTVLIVTNSRPEADRWTDVAELALRIGLGPRLQRPVVTEQIKLIVSTLLESAEQQLVIGRRTSANYEYFRTMLTCFGDSLYNNHGFGLLVFDGAGFHGRDADRWDPVELTALVSLARRFCPTAGCGVQLKLFLNSPNHRPTEPLLHRVYIHRLMGQFYAFALARMPHAAMIDRLAEVRLQIQHLLAEESMDTTGRTNLLKGTIGMLGKLCGDLLQLEIGVDDDGDISRIVMDWKFLKKFHTDKKLRSDAQMLAVLLDRLEKNIVKLIEKFDRDIGREKLNTLYSLASVLEEGICRLDLVNPTYEVSNYLDADACLFGLLGTAWQIRFGPPELIDDCMLKLLYWKESQLTRTNMLCQCTDTNVFAIIRLDVIVHHKMKRWCLLRVSCQPYVGHGADHLFGSTFDQRVPRIAAPPALRANVHSVSKKKSVFVKRSFHKNTKIGQMMNKWKKKMKIYLKKKNYFYVEDEGAVLFIFQIFQIYGIFGCDDDGAALPSALPLSSGAFAGSFCLVGRLSEACAWLLKLE
ncbi:Translation initiation factor [Trichinella spiralis]|uniref:Translation initiation factor n=1 Tax=Trichinella spiralis TaxID=6334 RepID=A0ABR3KH55_TRISP